MTSWAPSPAQCAAEAVQLVSVTLCNTDGILVFSISLVFTNGSLENTA